MWGGVGWQCGWVALVSVLALVLSRTLTVALVLGDGGGAVVEWQWGVHGTRLPNALQTHTPTPNVLTHDPHDSVRPPR